MDVESLANNWWAVALRGVAAIIFGVLTLALPSITLATLILLFGAYALVDGVFTIIAALRRRSGPPGGHCSSRASSASARASFILPGLTALVLLYVIAAWAIVTGVLEIVAAIGLRERITGEGWLALSGILSVVFGVLLVVAPSAGALALVLWIGAFSIVFGALLVALALRLRSWRGREVRPSMARAA